MARPPAFLGDLHVPINMAVSPPYGWMLRKMAARIGATVQDVQASHAVFMTQPKEVTDVIDHAARHPGGTK
ncbi:hypothetical protein [Variovorax arabinosiphilus]|uniref:hypothetical protein n=1 Tax=Variovorax arabinosiphilus TaxID=3053498 RepID=UPI002575FE6A|nr:MULTISPECIES: hypothetical protein [unclassified Variovorax]MDM0118366.1 hypothetical protein [Variovorax sp. J2L1-78]MDM0128791.1 hypothetical protein [Variovorax sp. J2L1-63]MDM0233423.1 hypothetical protein [Variovorax sp. J2R1-6]